VTKLTRLIVRSKLAGFVYSAERCLDICKAFDINNALAPSEHAALLKAYEAVRALRVSIDWDTAREADLQRLVKR